MNKLDLFKIYFLKSKNRNFKLALTDFSAD